MSEAVLSTDEFNTLEPHGDQQCKCKLCGKVLSKVSVQGHLNKQHGISNISSWNVFKDARSLRRNMGTSGRFEHAYQRYTQEHPMAEEHGDDDDADAVDEEDVPEPEEHDCGEVGAVEEPASSLCLNKKGWLAGHQPASQLSLFK